MTPFEFAIWDAQECANHLKKTKPYFLRVTRHKKGFPPALASSDRPQWQAKLVAQWALK